MNKKEVEKLAFFARIKLDDEELKNVPGEVDSILKYIQKLSNANTENVESLFHFPELKNVVRKDEAKTIDREVQKRMMAMGKDKDDYLRVEAIL